MLPGGCHQDCCATVISVSGGICYMNPGGCCALRGRKEIVLDPGDAVLSGIGK